MKSNKNLCLTCEIRGQCCYFSTMIEGHNVILDNQPCEYLDLHTGLCTIYHDKKRKDVIWCKDTNDDKLGGLPKECPYLKEDPLIEPNPKVNFHDIVHELSYEGLFTFNILNNINDITQIYGTAMRKEVMK